MDRKAATIVSAIESATRHLQTKTLGHEAPPLDPHKAWSMHCSAMFRETMRQLFSRGLAVSPIFTDENADANELGQRIQRNPEWIETQLAQVQSYINQGFPVVGVYINPNGPGHLAMGYPTELRDGRPVFRDGNIHKHGGITPSSYGAAPAEKVFGRALQSAKFYRYRHAVPLTKDELRNRLQ